MEDERASYDASKPRWYRRTWVVTVAAAAIALGVGTTAGASGDVRKTTEYRSLATDRNNVQGQLDSAEERLTETKQSLDQMIEEKAQLQLDFAELERDIPKREAAVEKAEKSLAGREKKVAKREKQVAAREKAVGVIEREIEANTISDGVYEVGVDIKADTYRKKDGNGCYYAILSSSDTNDIASNNLTDGPAVVTLSSGQYFESTRCGEWVLQR